MTGKEGQFDVVELMVNDQFMTSAFFCKIIDYIEASGLTLCETFKIMESAHKNIGEIPVSAIETDCCSK